CAATWPGVLVQGRTMMASGRYLVAGGCLAASLVALWTVLDSGVMERAYPLPQPTTLEPGSEGAPRSLPRLPSVAVNRSGSPDLKLRLGAGEAKAVAESITAAVRNGPYREVRSLVLTNGDATRESILGGLSRFLGQAGPDDVAVLFVAGHGIRDLTSGSYY